MTVGHREAHLLKRNELLEELWDVDDTIRDFRQADPHDPALPEMMEYRHWLAGEVRAMGAVAWEWHPDHDNSWLARMPLGETAIG